MRKTSLTPHQQRALAAAAGLVGRPRLRAGLLLTLVAACGPDKLDGETDSPESASDVSGESMSSTAAGTTGGTSATTSGGDASGGASTGGTLLTDATSLATSTTSGDTDTGASTGTGGTTGELGDCIDPSTGMTDWACCEKQGWMPVPQCTPWGPPAPPTAAAARLERARAARGRWV